ncbi:MAG: recombinase family protein, partial [Chloroflexi bacterium]|nr:recombinase family protein [Chloroflexota bacterium]
MKALGYLRAPRATAPPARMTPGPGDAGGRSGLTLEEQEQALRLLCGQHGHQLVASFVERPRGGQEGRAFLRLLERLDASPGEYGQVVVADLTLLAPTTKEIARRLLEVEHRGAAVLVASHTVGDPLLVVLRGWAKERERSLRRRRVREGMERRALRGLGLGRPAYGYRLDPGGRFQAVPDEAETVKRIFSLYAQRGLGLRRIVNQLNTDRVPTRSKGAWSVIAVRDLLRNRTYLGTYRRFGIRIPGSLPRLVEPELFQATQERLRAQGQRGRHGPGSRYLLSGLLYCGGCRGRLTAVRRRAGRTGAGAEGYYRCQRRGALPCPQSSYEMKGLEAAVRDELGRLASLDQPAAAPLAPSAGAAQQRALREQVQRLDQCLQRYLDRAAAGSLSPAGVRELSREPLRLRRTLQGQLARLEGKG